MHYYLRQLGSCPCGKAATYEVLGSQNESYGKFCKVCASRKKKELEKST